MKLLDGDDVLKISENEDEITESCNGVDMSADLGQKTCYICPNCPDTGPKRDYVVYCPCKKGGAKTLWQHWDREHKGQPKPALWKVHLVMGMKLEAFPNRAVGACGTRTQFPAWGL